jgi:hypothetical protein
MFFKSFLFCNCFGLGWAQSGKHSVGWAKGGEIVWDGLRVEKDSVGWAKGGKIV